MSDRPYGLPWSLGPLEGKYYTTHIVNRKGSEVLEVWARGVEPSMREDPDLVPTDSHYENHETHQLAVAICWAMNRSFE